MKIAEGEPFHVNCRFTKRAICYCLEGTPPELRDPEAAKEYYSKAEALYEYWERPVEALFAPDDAVDVLVPRLLRRQLVEDKDPPNPSPEYEEALQKLEAARQKASYSAMTAASLAARGGRVYNAPDGVNIKDFVDKLDIQDHSKLESAAADVMATRAEPSPVLLPSPILATSSMLPPSSLLGGQLEADPSIQHGLVTFPSSMPGMISEISGAQPSIDLGPLASPTEEAMGGKNISHPNANPYWPTSGIHSAAHKATSASPEPRFPAEHRRGPRKRAPPKAWRLQPQHNNSELVGKIVQVLWPEDKKWWPAIVVSVQEAEGTAVLVYENGEKEESVALAELIAEEHVAWLNFEIAQANVQTTAKKRPAPGPPHNLKPQQAAATPQMLGGATKNEYTGLGIAPDREEIALSNLKGVTKRQRAAAARQAAAATAAATTSHSGHNMSEIPMVTQPQYAQPISPAISLPMSAPFATPAGFVPMDSNGAAGGMRSPAYNPSMAQQAQQTYGNGAVSSPQYTMAQQQQQSSLQSMQNPQQGLPQQQQQPYGSGGANGPSQRVVPHILQIGSGMIGLSVTLHISGIALEGTIKELSHQQEAVIVEIRGRPVVLRARDEGIRYALAVGHKGG